MFEDAKRPLLSRRRFASRMAVFLLAALLMDGAAMAVGAIGYRYFEGLDWLDASLNATLVMTGNGPIHQPLTSAGKLFAIADAILGTIVFVAVVGVLLVPVFHRILHGFHRGHKDKEDDEKDERQTAKSSQQQPASPVAPVKGT